MAKILISTSASSGKEQYDALKKQIEAIDSRIEKLQDQKEELKTKLREAAKSAGIDTTMPHSGYVTVLEVSYSEPKGGKVTAEKISKKRYKIAGVSHRSYALQDAGGKKILMDRSTMSTLIKNFDKLPAVGEVLSSRKQLITKAIKR